MVSTTKKMTDFVIEKKLGKYPIHPSTYLPGTLNV